MHARSFSRASDQDLLRRLASLATQERTSTTELVACIAEVDARRLYVQAGYSSMRAYCVQELRLSEDAAFKRIRAARAGRRFPAVLEALAEGRLHLSAVVLLAPHLTRENVDELLTAATHKTRTEVELLVAERFPRSEVLPMVQQFPVVVPPQSGPDGFQSPEAGEPADRVRHRVEASVDQLAPGPVDTPAARSKITPIAAQRYEMHLSMAQRAYDKLRHFQALLSHAIPSGDVAAVLERALDLAIPQVEKRKYGATTRPRRNARETKSARHIPAHVRYAVWKRDGDQCTFVSESGHRCRENKFLELDHIDPVAGGGQSTIENLRLRCRTHNQYEAERAFGTEFMENKRHEARRASKARQVAKARRTAAQARIAAEARAREVRAEEKAREAETVRAQAIAKERADEVIPYLRRLGFRSDESRRAAALCETNPDATLEERVRLALSHFCPVARTHAPRATA